MFTLITAMATIGPVLTSPRTRTVPRLMFSRALFLRLPKKPSTRLRRFTDLYHSVVPCSARWESAMSSASNVVYFCVQTVWGSGSIVVGNAGIVPSASNCDEATSGQQSLPALAGH